MPTTELAEEAGLEVDDGILVDELRARRGATTCSRPATWRVSRCPLSAGRGVSSTRITRTRTAVLSAPTWPAQASDTITSRSSTPTSSTSATRRSATSTRLDTVTQWAELNRKGVVAYVDADGKARGFLLWDVWDKVDAARELIRAGTVVDASDLRRLLD